MTTVDRTDDTIPAGDAPRQDSGARRIMLTGPKAPATPMLGRIVADGLPCTVDLGTGHPGCGGADTMTIVRLVLRGLNLPGERIVGMLEYCTLCGPGTIRPVTPTPGEIADGWAPGTVA